MAQHSKNSGAGCLANLLTLAGLLLVIAAGIAAYPSIRAAVEPTPVDFGETAPPLRPTVTPLPAPGSHTAAPPVELPETPLLSPDQPQPTPQARLTSTSNASQGAPTRLVIPAIQLDAPVITVGWHQENGGNVWDVPNEFAAGWLKISAPLGESGNTVLDGHHNIAGQVFRYLVDLKPGDEIDVYSNNKLFLYKVTSRLILPERDQPIEVRLKNAQWIQSTQDERLTLVTCWPFTNNTHRLIVVAKPLDPGDLGLNQ